MERSTIIGAVAGFAGAIVIGTVAVANAASTSPSPSAATPSQQGYPEGGRPDGGGAGRAGGQHTPVTGDELSKVKAAVAAKASGVTVTSVEKDADGSYDVRGTKAGSPVMVEVSKDLATVQVRQGGPGGGREGHGMRMGTEVDAATLAKIKAAVSAKDSAVTVERAVALPDGSYGAMGTKAGQRVMVHLSKDLSTVDVETRGQHDHGPMGGQGGGTGPSSVPSATATGASTTA